MTKNIVKNNKNYSKYIWLSVTLLITIGIFSMSLFSGTDSANMSLGVSSYVKKILDSIFVNNNVQMEILNTVIRKAAHLFEYMLLGVTYYFTAKKWNLSILKVMVLGLITATVDELLQNIPLDRFASALDIFLFDFGGFILGFGFFLLINNKKKLNEREILKLLDENKISVKKAYKQIYRSGNVIRFTNRAHFIKLKIIIPDEKGVNTFLRILFFLPFPIFILDLVLPFIKMDGMGIDKIGLDLSKADILKLIKSKGINIVVNASSNERIIIKTI